MPSRKQSLAYASGYLIGCQVSETVSAVSTDEPIAFFLTWVTYGSWLPGDDRGWVEYRHGWQLPNARLEADCESRMNDDAIRLTAAQRRAVEEQIKETCRHREWKLYATNCRSNHVHAVVASAETSPKKIRVDLKAYTTRCLNSLAERKGNWWAERGSVRWVFTDDDLASVTAYVIDGQVRKPEA